MSALLYTEKALSAKTGFAVGTLRNWRTQGKGPAFIKVGAAVRYRPEDVQAWIATFEPEQTPASAA